MRTTSGMEVALLSSMSIRSSIENRIDQQQLFQLKLDMTSSRREEVVRERSKKGELTSSRAQLVGAELKAKNAQVDGVARGDLALLRELNELQGQSLQADIQQRPQQRDKPDRTAASFKATFTA